MMTPTRDFDGSILIEWPAPHLEVFPLLCGAAPEPHADRWAVNVRDADTGEKISVQDVKVIVEAGSGFVTAEVTAIPGPDGEPVRGETPFEVVIEDGALKVITRRYIVAGMSVTREPAVTGGAG